MSFTNIKIGNLEYLQAANLPAAHCFTTRLGGVSTGVYASLNIGMHRGDAPENVAENVRRVTDALGVETTRLVLTRQTHSDIVRPVTWADHAGLDHRNYPESDGLITNTPGTALLVFTADCTPILLHDPVTGAVGAVHAGWRGTAQDIAGKAVAAMVASYGCDPANIRAAIGPNLAACCFQTDADVPEAMGQTFGEAVNAWIRYEAPKYYVNLKEINAHALRRAGVTQIAISRDCTMCSHDRYWSHRHTRGIRGSQGAIIVCGEGNI